MTIKMNPTVDRMLGLTADIAEELLLVKDAGYDTLPDGLKLKIISLAELAATVDSTAETEDSVAVEEERQVERQPADIPADIPAVMPSVMPSDDSDDSDDSDETEVPHPASAVTPEDEHMVAQGEDELGETRVEAEVAEGAEAMEAEESAETEAISEEDAIEEPAVGEPSICEAPGEAEAASAEFEEEEDADVEEVVEPQPVRRIDPAAIYQAFSINDAFFYRREIFGGSREQFLESLVRISTLPDRRALQEYLVEHLGLNLNQSPGKEFYHSIVVFF